MVKFGMGQAVRRTEDQRFVTGHGRFTDDIDLAHQAYGHVLRSPHAHARIASFLRDGTDGLNPFPSSGEACRDSAGQTTGGK